MFSLLSPPEVVHLGDDGSVFQQQVSLRHEIDTLKKMKITLDSLHTDR